MDIRPETAPKSVPLEASQDTMRRLMLAKQFLGHAIDHALAPGALNQMIAVHNLHSSVEIALRATAMACGVLQVRRDPPFSELIPLVQTSAIAKDNGIVLLFVPEVRELAEWRNLAQHAATEPDPSRIASWIQVATQFVAALTMSFFGVEYSLVSAADLLQDRHARSLLKAAEGLQLHLASLSTPAVDEFQLPNDDHFEPYQVSLALLAAAFVLAFDQASRSVLFADFQGILDVPDLLCDLEEKSPTDDALATVWRRLKRLESATMLNILGVDYHRYQELVEVSPRVVLIEGGRTFVDPQLSEVNPDPVQVSRFISFVTDLLLRWEGRGWLGAGIASLHGPDEPFVRVAQDAVDGRIPQLLQALGSDEIVRLGKLKKIRSDSMWPQV